MTPSEDAVTAATKAVAERLMREFIGQGSLAAAEAVISPDVLAHTGLSPAEPLRGRDAYVRTFMAFAQAFSFETPVEIVDSFFTGDRAMLRIRTRARHTGTFLGLAPTGRSILFDETHLMRIADGLLVENVVSATNLEFEMVFAPALTPLVLGKEA